MPSPIPKCEPDPTMSCAADGERAEDCVLGGESKTGVPSCAQQSVQTWEHELNPQLATELSTLFDRLEHRLIHRLDDWADRQHSRLAARMSTDGSLPKHTPASTEGMKTISEYAGSCEEGALRASTHSQGSSCVPGLALPAHHDRSFTADDLRKRLVAQRHAIEKEEEKEKLGSSDSLQRVKKKLEKIVRGSPFEALVSLAIVINALFIGFEVQYSVQHEDKQKPLAFFIVNCTFTLIFFLELLARIWVLKRKLFAKEERFWGILDTLLVVSSIVSACVEAAIRIGDGSQTGVDISNVRILRIVRVTRLIRCLRVARLIRFVSSLRTIVASIVATLQSLFWSLLLLFLVIYMHAIIFTEAATEHCSGDVECQADEYWGTLWTSMFTLFQSISGGVSWRDCVEPLESTSPVIVFIFASYIFFTTFAVMNVLTGVFCQSAIETVGADPDYEAQAVLSRRKTYKKNVERLFARIDADNSETITLHEMENAMSDEYTVAYLSVMGVDATEAWSLFRLMDKNEDGAIDRSEFVAGLQQLQGQARSVDLVALLDKQRWMSSRIANLTAQLGQTPTKTTESLEW